MAAKTGKKKATFEEQLLELEKLIGQMESGSMGLEESLKAYEQGSAMLTSLEKELAEATRRVTILRQDESGEDVEEAFIPEEDA